MRRGDVWWATLQPRSGSEQSGRRPVVVLSHDSFNQTPNWKSVTLAVKTRCTILGLDHSRYKNELLASSI